uniref:ISXO2-like transposase domain-containing protein n=1 Tax=Octopus bimaculoides TaxID=37653 RepID=A0A0L8HY66_OCTBM
MSSLVQWYQYMKGITSNYLLRNLYQIGGLERKYNRGWDREDKNRFLERCSSKTLQPLIKKFIKPGTTIYSDCWSAYNGITEIDVTPKYTLEERKTTF